VSKREISIILHTDAKHSYLEVSADLVSELSLLDKLTKHSYISRLFDTFFLECDVDGQLFIDALEDNGIDFSFEERLHDGLCEFRNFPRVGYIQ
tara:strand:+ start:202 stop:483 length:282 start_codon:yes stop_codon:yes gene_type:complete